MASFRVLLHPALRHPPQELSEVARQELLLRLEMRLRFVWTQPVQMLVEVAGYDPLAVSVSAVKGRSAACTWFRNVRLEGGKVVGGDLDAVSLVLSGEDAAVDEQVVTATAAFRDEAGYPLPFPPDWLQRVREHERPLLAHWSRSDDAAGDLQLNAAAEMIALLLLRSQTVQ